MAKKIARFLLLGLLVPSSLYLGLVMVNENRLRDLYNAEVVQIPAKALLRYESGELDLEGATRWAIEARNRTKVEVRDLGNPINKRLAELRNLDKYQDPIGPDYDFLMAAVQREGDAKPDVHLKIIQGSGRTSTDTNERASQMEAAGWGLALFALLGSLAAVLLDRRKMPALLAETARLAGALAGGRLGVWAGVSLAGLAGWDAHTVALGVAGGLLGVLTLSNLPAAILRRRYAQEALRQEALRQEALRQEAKESAAAAVSC
jgi:hypothetical protein